MENVILIPVGFLAFLFLFRWIMREPVRGLYAAIFASGILITPTLPLVRDKFAAAEVLMLMTWTAMVIGAENGHQKPLSGSQRQVIFWGIGFMMICLFSFIGNLFRMPNDVIPHSLLETAIYVYGVLVFITVLMLVDTWEKWYRCLYAWLLSAAIVCVIGLWAMKGGAPAWTYDEFTGRISSTLKFENQLPSFLLPIFVTCLFLAVLQSGISTRWRIAFMVLSGAIIIVLFGTGSRTVYLMLVVCFAGLAWVALREKRFNAFKFARVQAIAFVLIAGIILFIASVLMTGQSYQGLGQTPAYERPILMLADWIKGNRALDEGRDYLIQVVWQDFTNYILLGTGPKLFTLTYHMSEVHNTYLSLLIETGLFGAMTFLFWYWNVGYLSWRSLLLCKDHQNRLLGFSLLVGLMALFVYGLFMLGVRQRNIWFLAGLLMAIPRLGSGGKGFLEKGVLICKIKIK